MNEHLFVVCEFELIFCQPIAHRTILGSAIRIGYSFVGFIEWM